MACKLGFSEECIVAAGAGDNAAAAIGTGTVGAGKCNLSLGTSGTLFITSDEFRVDSHNALHSFDHADGGYHWRKIVANVMNMQVDTVEVEEGPAYGGAILAAVANGCFENVEAAAEAIVRKKDTTMPSPQLVEKYEKGYATFKQFYPALKGKY